MGVADRAGELLVIRTTTVGVVVLMLFPIIDTFLINDNELFICAYVCETDGKCVFDTIYKNPTHTHTHTPH